MNGFFLSDIAFYFLFKCETIRCRSFEENALKNMFLTWKYFLKKLFVLQNVTHRSNRNS